MQGDGLVWAKVPMGDYTIQIGFSSARRDVQPLYVGLIIVVIGAAIVFVTSLFIVQRIARPMVRAAQLVETFRGGEEFRPCRSKVRASWSRSPATSTRWPARSLRCSRIAPRCWQAFRTTLRTPLTRMRLALELLPRNVDRKLVERFERNLEVMDGLIGDALRFARGTQRVADGSGAGALRAPRCSRASSTRFHSPSSAADGPLRLPIATGALQRVLAEHRGQRAAARRSTCACMSRVREIHVIDAGPGIPAESREAVFEPFFRLDSSRNVHTGGSGLGLAIVRQLCQAQGWLIEIRDRDGGGTDAVLTVCRSPA